MASLLISARSVVVDDPRLQAAPYSGPKSDRFRRDTLVYCARQLRSSNDIKYLTILKALLPHDYQGVGAAAAMERVLHAYQSDSLYASQIKQVARLLGCEEWNELTVGSARAAIESVFAQEYLRVGRGAGGSYSGTGQHQLASSRQDREALLNCMKGLLRGQRTAQPMCDNYVFVLDMSRSMGRGDRWSLAKCSRLCVGIGFISAFIDRQLHSSDTYSVLCFDGATDMAIIDKERKGSGYDAVSKMKEMASEIEAIRGDGSAVYSALVASEPLVQKDCYSSAKNFIVLITDGEATDGRSMFEEARNFVCNPPDRCHMALVEIEDCRSRQTRLKELIKDYSGRKLAYMHHTRLPLPQHSDPRSSSELRQVVGQVSSMASDRKNLSARRVVVRC